MKIRGPLTAPVDLPMPARLIVTGMVFTGSINDLLTKMTYTGTFLKLYGHVVHLESDFLIGCGISSPLMVKNFISYPDSILIVK